MKLNVRTEAEAREVWCPYAFSVIPSVNTIVANRMENHISPMQKCIASQCAMWQWSDISLVTDGRDDKGLIIRMKEEATQGFCGLVRRA